MIDYPSRYRSALVSMVRDLLDQASMEGLPGDHAHYLSFRTSAPEVGLSPSLRDIYPDTMTIVIQHQFRDLVTDDEGFSVTLRFGGRPESLYVPWAALTSFVDPVAEFGFELPPAGSAEEGSADDGADVPGPAEAESGPGRGTGDADAKTPSGDRDGPAGADSGAAGAGSEPAEVVSFDRFRDARRPKES